MSALGVYAIYKYTPLPKWFRKNIFKEDTDNIDGSISKHDKFPLSAGNKKIPEVAVVQLSLNMPLTGTLSSDDISMFNLKYIENIDVITEDDYNIFFRNNENAFKNDLGAFYKHETL